MNIGLHYEMSTTLKHNEQENSIAPMSLEFSLSVPEKKDA